jgi:hypothetical protein
MHLGHRRLDVAVGQARQPDVAIGIVAAEVGEPRVVDAQHLGGGLAVGELRGRGEDAVDDLGVDAVAVHLLDPQVRIARPANALLAVLVEAGRGHDVHPQLLARLVLRARRAHAAREAERCAVLGDPSRPVRPVGHIRHAVLQGGGRLGDEQGGGQPDQIEMAIRGDPVVGHSASDQKRL